MGFESPNSNENIQGGRIIKTSLPATRHGRVNPHTKIPILIHARPTGCYKQEPLKLSQKHISSNNRTIDIRVLHGRSLSLKVWNYFSRSFFNFVHHQARKNTLPRNTIAPIFTPSQHTSNTPQVYTQLSNARRTHTLSYTNTKQRRTGTEGPRLLYERSVSLQVCNGSI